MRVSFIAYLILFGAFAPAVRGAPLAARRANHSAPSSAAVEKRVEGDSTRAPEYFIVILADKTNVLSHLSWVSAVFVANGAAPVPGVPLMPAPGDGNSPSDGTPTPSPGDGNTPNDGTPTPSPGDGNSPDDGTPAPSPGAPNTPGSGAPPADGLVQDLPAADETDPEYGGGSVVPCPGNTASLTGVDGPVDASDASLSGFVGVGYWGYFPAGLIDVIKANPDVVDAIEDSTAEIAVIKGRTVTPHDSTPPHMVTQSSAPWQLARLSSRKPDPSKTYHYNSLGGANVTMHIIDSGIQTSHSEFGGRAKMVWAARPYTSIDENGHGTFVAALAAGATYGVAKSATVLGYRVFDKSGTGYASDIMAAINRVTLSARHNNGSHIINLSLALPSHRGVDLAVTRAARLGIHVVAAGGNGATDASNISPARSSGAISVGASTLTDRRASFSNFGVDVYAPGEGVRSATLGSSTSVTTFSGTSMAAPLVAGVLAVELSIRGPQRPNDMSTWLTNTSGKAVSHDSSLTQLWLRPR